MEYLIVLDEEVMRAEFDDEQLNDPWIEGANIMNTQDKTYYSGGDWYPIPEMDI